MKVTLDVFSGRENPSWELNEKEAKSLLERVAGKSVLTDAQHDSKLGFSGFKIEATSDERLPEGVGDSFYIGTDLAAGISGDGLRNPLLGDKEITETFDFLLSKAGKAVDDDIASYVKSAIKNYGKGTHKEAPTADAEDTELKALSTDAPCIIANTAYNPGFWNVPAVQPHNNCYNYAMNFKSNTFAQPGRKTGHMYTSLDCNSVGNGATSDGCKVFCSGSSKLVALVIWPGHDYHWYRRHSNGFWGHKPGSTAARNTDNSGILINGITRTPFNCNRGPYTVFCGYRYSPTGMQVS
ncbi:MAG: hypothetical protein ABIQ88_02000 [Chitinophagaceae bacterium]